jgi:hypothetical protein
MSNVKLSSWPIWRKLLDMLPKLTGNPTRRSKLKANRVKRGERLEDRRLLTVDLQFATPMLNEVAGAVVLTASLSAPATTNTDVTLAFGGKAVRGQDYQVNDLRIAIAAGNSSGSITLTSVDDALSEADELIEARIAAITGTTELWNGQPAYTRIVDNDSPLLLAGTPGNDVLSVWLYNTTFIYRLNSDPVQTVSYSTVRSIKFLDNSVGDLDTIVLATPASGGGQVELTRDGIVISGANPFELASTNAERQYVNGNENDQATIQGTTGNDDYWGLPTHSVTKVGKMQMQVTGIRNVTMNSNGGQDRARLFSNGNTSTDTFRGDSMSAMMTKTGGIPGDMTKPFSNTVKGFRYVYGYADDTKDIATFDDSPSANDTFFAKPGLSYMLASANSAYQNIAYYYANVVANSTGGNDGAYLYDSPLVDTLRANNASSRIDYADGSNVLAQGFRDVIAKSEWNATVDRVFLSDSSIADIDATSSNILERSRNDHLSVYKITAEMNYGNRRVGVSGFEQLTAASTQGGTDTFSLLDNSFVKPVIAGFVNEQSLTTSRRESLQAARAYLRDTRKFDLNRYLTRGIDYLNSEFADIVSRLSLEWSQQFPSRPPLTVANVDQVIGERIYDYSRLEQVEQSLSKIDRQSVLQRLFDEITRNSKNNVERQTAIIEFGHKSLQHSSYIQPLNYDLTIRAQTGRFIGNGTDVRDPLVLLELAEGRCGQANKLIADIWHSLGFRVRLLGVNSHTSGEVMYEGQWHYNDAGLFGSREIPLMPVTSGSAIMKVPSLEEMAAIPSLVDRLALYVGVYRGNMLPYSTSPEYASLWYFEDLKDNYITIEKGAAADARAQGSRDYGWNSYMRGQITWIKWINTEPHNTQPSAPLINQVAVNSVSNGGSVTIGWQSSYDNIRKRVDSQGNPVLTPTGALIYDWFSPKPPHTLYSDVVGYSVYVGTTSRGWNYNVYQGRDSVSANVQAFKASNAIWNPTMYDARYSTPPRDVMTLWAPATATQLGANELVNIKLPASGTYYITVMAIDSKGLAIGKNNYLQSEEIKVTI